MATILTLIVTIAWYKSINAPMEIIWGTLKNELVRHFKIRNVPASITGDQQVQRGLLQQATQAENTGLPIAYFIHAAILRNITHCLTR